MAGAHQDEPLAFVQSALGVNPFPGTVINGTLVVEASHSESGKDYRSREITAVLFYFKH